MCPQGLLSPERMEKRPAETLGLVSHLADLLSELNRWQAEGSETPSSHLVCGKIRILNQELQSPLATRTDCPLDLCRTPIRSVSQV